MDGFLYKRDPQNPTPPVWGGGQFTVFKYDSGIILKPLMCRRILCNQLTRR